jgi:predicted AAA+ superfamily ATPase
MSQTPAIPRLLNLDGLLAKKSHFLLGPRQTGKSFLIGQSLKAARVYDLLDTSLYLALSHRPQRLAEELTSKDHIVVIDEIQRLPVLLNEVHRLIEQRGIRFLLTGSSARKLRQGGVNLLGGRARTKYLHPLTSNELATHFDLDRFIARGGLPSIYFSDDPRTDLNAYAGSYLQQEIVAEGATRNIAAFSRFLKVSAYCNATIVNFTNVATDAQVPRTTVYEYFEILKDTLILHELPAWRETKQRKPLASSKYYFFDIGVVSAIQERQYRRGTPEYGEAMETYLFHELKSYVDYVSGEPIAFWKSKSGFEVDFILGDHTAIELKASENVAPNDLKSLKALAEEKKLKRYLCISLEPRRRQVGGITILPIHEFLKNLWDETYA